MRSEHSKRATLIIAMAKEIKITRLLTRGKKKPSKKTPKIGGGKVPMMEYAICNKHSKSVSYDYSNHDCH